jgi:two-component system, OmpR family, response regulator
MRVLLIEDDQRLARLITGVLAEEGIACEAVFDGDSGAELALRGGYDVAIVDWMLPGRDGPAICRAIRAARLPTAVLLLTARGQVEDRVAGLNNGADDYLVKPFAFAELVARVRALGRRFAVVGADAAERRVGDIVLDHSLHAARRGDASLDLTPTEWELLDFLLRHPGQALTRQQILDAVWSYDADVLPTQVDVYIAYLRRKLHRPGALDPIETVRGVGYRLRAADV